MKRNGKIGRVKYWLDIKTGETRGVDDNGLIKWREEIGPKWSGHLVRISKKAYKRLNKVQQREEITHG